LLFEIDIAIVIGIWIFFLEFQELFQLFVSSPHKKGKVSNVPKRASAGRFFRPGNFCLFYSGLSTSIWAMKPVFKIKFHSK
jgi:hypothetical protein